jgi:hypothetical protein
VIADLTDHNPNVFYEMAIRHVVRKPIVQLIQAGQKIPFDVSPMRTIEFNLSDPDELLEAVGKLKRQIDEVGKNPAQADNPISSAIDLQNLRSSSDPNAKVNFQILERLNAVSADMADMKRLFRVISLGPLTPGSGKGAHALLLKAFDTVAIKDIAASLAPTTTAAEQPKWKWTGEETEQDDNDAEKS